MLVAKQVADIVTLSRAIIAVWLGWLGFSEGAEALGLVVWLMIADWGGDLVDGMLARRSRTSYHTWIGDHDLEVDMAVSAGLLVYMIGAGFFSLLNAAFYLVFWAVIFWRFGFQHALGMLIQAPVYGWFIWIAIITPPHVGWWIVAWITTAIVITWPRFPRQVIPGFVNAMAMIFRQERWKRLNRRK
jgi:phosphatidylglycerophosphate synthase